MDKDLETLRVKILRTSEQLSKIASHSLKMDKKLDCILKNQEIIIKRVEKINCPKRWFLSPPGKGK